MARVASGFGTGDPAGGDGTRPAASAAPVEMTRPTSQGSDPMRRAMWWAGLPVGGTVLGVALWFTLIPGRSGAG